MTEAPPVPAGGELTEPLEREPEPSSVSLAKRLRDPKTIVSFVIGVLLLVTVFKKLGGDLNAAVGYMAGLNPWLYLLAFVAYALTFPARGLRWQRLLRNVQEPQSGGKLTEYLFLSWFVNCLVPAKIGDVYRGYLLKKNDNVSISKSMGTIFAERIIDTLTIFVAFGLTGLAVFHNSIPPQIRPYLIAGVVLGVICAGALLFMRHLGEAVFARFGSPRVQRMYKRFEEGTLGSFKSMEVVLTLTFAAWLFESLRLFAVAHALAGGPPELASFNLVTAIFGAVAASILTLVPTPGGLGAVEGGVTGVLILAGYRTPGLALAIVIMDRIVSYWTLVLGGAVAYFVSKRK
ncbi:MAG TPA: lysylphosphatidylglycerol synthase transmembrane domain-containing protein [Chloroflexota bacterium]|nr:lysylphosphatidylglycerol synthase transmembrane domain-containing protein [Chloroflexota bacterium]